MANYFDSFCNEGNKYINNLASELGHPEAIEKTVRLLKGVLHAIRDRITISESLHVLAQLPMPLKALYVDQWTFREEPLRYQTMEEFTETVKSYQKHYGEQAFDWNEHTADLAAIILSSLREMYLSDGETIHIMSQLPKEVQEIF